MWRNSSIRLADQLHRAAERVEPRALVAPERLDPHHADAGGAIRAQSLADARLGAEERRAQDHLVRHAPGGLLALAREPQLLHLDRRVREAAAAIGVVVEVGLRR